MKGCRAPLVGVGIEEIGVAGVGASSRMMATAVDVGAAGAGGREGGVLFWRAEERCALSALVVLKRLGAL